jgi:hypothetical protein
MRTSTLDEGFEKGTQHFAALIEILFDPMIDFVSYLHIHRYYLSALILQGVQLKSGPLTKP